MRVHPKPEASIPISLAVRYQLLDGSASSGWDKEDWEIAEEAINEWTRRHNPDALAASAMTGYQWKSQFLPDGTVLRTVFGGKNHHCRVEGDRILYKEKAVSPSGFVNAVGGIRRNAWRCTWILFPDSKEWKLADTLRTSTRPRRARKPEAAFQQPPAPQPAAANAPNGVVPASVPLAAANTPQTGNSQHAIHHQPPPGCSTGGQSARQRRKGIVPPAAGCRCGTERRNCGDGSMAALLRQELLPLLHRMAALNGTPAELRTRVQRDGAAVRA